MRKIDKLRDYLLENYVNEVGDLDISGLDFSKFDGDVYLCDMKVKCNLFQDCQKVKGDLSQDGQEVQGDLYQSNQTVQGILCNRFNKYGVNLYEEPSTKLSKEITTEELVKEITMEELAKLGHKTKEG